MAKLNSFGSAHNTIQFIYLYLHEWLIFMVNVGKHTKSHGCYGCLNSYVEKALESLSPFVLSSATCWNRRVLKHPTVGSHHFSRQNLGPRDLKLELLVSYI